MKQARRWTAMTVAAGTLLLFGALTGCKRENVGACCHYDGSCSEVYELECDGIFAGKGTKCVETGCVVGACCDGQTCDVVLQGQCLDPRIFQGEGTTCEPNPCVTGTTGACCGSDASCDVTTQADCDTAGGRFLGDETTCDASGGMNPCITSPTGACCGSDASCDVMNQADCGAANGRFLGAETTCDASGGANPCEAAGACCLNTGGCIYTTTDTDCVAAGGRFGGAGTGCADACPPPSLEWTSDGQAVAEDVGLVTLQAAMSGPWDTPITANYTVTGSAGNPADHDLDPGAVSFPVGTTVATVTFHVVDDSEEEGDETVVATLGAPTGGAGLGATVSHTVTIADNDGPSPTVRFTAAAQAVPESVGQVTATLQLSAAQSQNVTVNYAVAGTATHPADHNLTAGSMTILAGNDTAPLAFNVVDDDTIEPNETVVITLTGATGGVQVAAPDVHTVTIQDNDLPTVEWTAAAQTVSEDVGQVTVTAHLSQAIGQDVLVDFTVGGTAGNPDDHNLVAGTVTITAGNTSGNVVFHVQNDTVQEQDETVVLTLTNVHGGLATIGAQSVHTVTITDDDGPLTITPPAPPDGICRTHTGGEALVGWFGTTGNYYGSWDFVANQLHSFTSFVSLWDGVLNAFDSALAYQAAGSTFSISAVNPTLQMTGMSIGLFATGADFGEVTGGTQDLWRVYGGLMVQVDRQWDFSTMTSASQESAYLPAGTVAQFVYYVPGVPAVVVLDPQNGTLYLVDSASLSVLDTQPSIGWWLRGEGADSWFLGVTNAGDGGGDPTDSFVYLYDGVGHSFVANWANPNGTGGFRTASLDSGPSTLVGVAGAGDGYVVIVIDPITGNYCQTWVAHADGIRDAVVVVSQDAIVMSTEGGNLEKWPLSPLLCTP